jgi:hypothetical protein
VLDDLILAPEEDGDVEVVYSGLLGLRELELVEVEQAGHMPAGDQPPVDVLGDLLLAIADLIHQWSAADELVQVLHGRDERWGRRRGACLRRRLSPRPRREGRRAVIRARQETCSNGEMNQATSESVFS